MLICALRAAASKTGVPFGKCFGTSLKGMSLAVGVGLFFDQIQRRFIAIRSRPSVSIQF